jgi:hypothetical protein
MEVRDYRRGPLTSLINASGHRETMLKTFAIDLRELHVPVPNQFGKKLTAISWVKAFSSSSMKQRPE